MAVVIAPKLMDIAAADDPKRALIENVGDLSGVRVYGQSALVASYIGPEKTRGGIYRTRETIAEYEWQGNVGLVLKLGLSTDEHDEEEFLHKWVMFGCNEGMRYHLNGVACRTIALDRIRQQISDPSMVY